jgi:transposase
MEVRRREAARLIRQRKLSYSAIARLLSVSRMAVSQWAKQLDSRGLRAIKSRAVTGRPTRLNQHQSKDLLRSLERGAVAAGFSTERWTLARIQQVIWGEFQAKYHPCYLSRWLRARNWSVRLPITRNAGRDEQLIRAWLSQDWPRIKKSAASARRYHLL